MGVYPRLDSEFRACPDSGSPYFTVVKDTRRPPKRTPMTRTALLYVPKSCTTPVSESFMSENVAPCGRLALELLLKIASEASSSELVLLSRLCRYYNVVFYGCLYSRPKSSAVWTLAQYEFDRLPLTTPHPASFVKFFTIGADAPSGIVNEALQNIEAYGSSLRGLIVSTPSDPLSCIVQSPLPSFLQSIRELSLRVPYPRHPQGLALNLAVSSVFSHPLPIPFDRYLD
jgi:hypothetical protein